MSAAYKLHWYVDPNTGIAVCGAGANGVAMNARETHDVTCARCRRMPEWAHAAAESRRRLRAPYSGPFTMPDGSVRRLGGSIVKPPTRMLEFRVPA